jgi:uncharacterized membrane protein HdeD (DUF308 family)
MLGVFYVLTGLIALSSVALATATTVFVVGVMMLIAGVAQVINAFQLQSGGKALHWGMLGMLYIVAGIMTFENPLLAAMLLTFLVGAMLVASGALRLILAFDIKEEIPWAGVACSGVITMLVGGVFLIHWPVSSVYVLGILLGLDLVFTGSGWILVGLGLKSRIEGSGG